MASGTIDRERERVREIRDDLSGWRRWGPYVSDRSWGTVREDYSHDGDAWGYLPHDLARARRTAGARTASPGSATATSSCASRRRSGTGAIRILKERLFGVNPYEGNHGEDVKEYYFHLDNTPTPLVHESALQVSAGGVSVPRADRGEPAPRRTGSGVRAARHRRLRRRSLLRHLHRIRQGRAGGHSDPHRGASTAGPTPRRCTSCRTCGSATPGPGGRRRVPSRRSRAGPRKVCA